MYVSFAIFGASLLGLITLLILKLIEEKYDKSPFRAGWIEALDIRIAGAIDWIRDIDKRRNTLFRVVNLLTKQSKRLLKVMGGWSRKHN